MRIFDETKTYEVFSPDLEKGYLRDDNIVIAHHAATPHIAGKWHYETVKTYANGGKDVERVYDIPEQQAKPAWDEYEAVKVYVPYTAEQLKEKRIVAIKERLSKLSEDFVQSWAGAYIADIDARKQEFADLHNELRVLLGKTPRTYF